MTRIVNYNFSHETGLFLEPVNKIYILQEVDKNFIINNGQNFNARKKWYTRYWISSPTSNTSNTDQNLWNNSFQATDKRQHRTVIPERWGNQASPRTATAFRKLRGGKRRQRLSTSALRTQRWEWGEAREVSAHKIRVWERKELHRDCSGGLQRDPPSESPTENWAAHAANKLPKEELPEGAGRTISKSIIKKYLG